MARYEISVGADIAAPGGTAEAHYELGCLYAAGRTLPADLVAAHAWFNVAAAGGYRPAATRRCELAAEMSAAEIALAQRKARLILARA